MARKIGSKNIVKRKKARSAYETYLGWVKEYGGKHPLSEEQFTQAKNMLKNELKEQGKSTTNLSRQLAQKTSFTYSYETGRAIKMAYEEMGFGKITISEARNVLTYDDKSKKALKPQQLEGFWESVSDFYTELRRTNSSAVAKTIISETIFGSP